MTPTSTITVDQLRGDILADAMRKLHADPSKLPADFYSATVEPGVAMLVEPVNDCPYVFIPPNVVHRFEAQPGSGTDFLRKRMQAGFFFQQVVQQALRLNNPEKTGRQVKRADGLTREERSEASAQGWNVFDAEGDLQIQREDERDVFPGDGDAWLFVIREALDRPQSAAAKALRLIRAESPGEYRRILEHDQKNGGLLSKNAGDGMDPELVGAAAADERPRPR